MAEAGERVTLSIDGVRHEGWTSVSVTRAIDTMVGEFTLEVTDRWAERPTSFPLSAGASCTLAIGDEVVITGYIDRLSPRIDASGHSISIAGRDRAGDLIDCSAVHTPGSWRDSSIEAIAAELAKPFGVAVTARASTGPKLRRFALQQGESVQEALERMCRFAGLLAVSTPAGDVELIAPAKAGSSAETFADGVNILAASAEHDASGRFSSYLVKGQASADDFVHGKAATGPSGTATDPGVKRHRPLLIVAEDQTNIANAGMRARWEASTRAARCQQATITAAGWRWPSGKLRAPNTIVTLDSAWMFMAGPMLVQAVTLDLGEGGTTSTLTVVPPEAWSQLAVPDTANVSRVGKAKTSAR